MGAIFRGLGKKIYFHRLAIFLAILFGFLIIYPYIYFRFHLGNEFLGVDRQFVDDELFYLGRIQDIVDGHSFLSNTYLFEHKNGLPQQLFLAEYLLAKPLEVFGISVITGHLLYGILLPFIIFLFVYGIFYLLTRSRIWSLMFSVFAFFGLFLIQMIRPVSPQFNFLFFISQFIFLWLTLSEHPRKKIFFIFSVINLGLLFYIYPYYWTLYYIFLGLLCITFFFYDRKLAYRFFGIAVLGAFLGGYYLWYTYNASLQPEYTATMLRLGMLQTRFPSGDDIILWVLGVLTFVVVALYTKYLKFNKELLFLVVGPLSALIAVNQHIITNRNFEFSSHYYMPAVFLCLFLLAYVSYIIFKKMPVPAKYLFAMGMSLFLVIIPYSLVDFLGRAKIISIADKEIQEYAPLFNWLNANTKKDSVVYADPVLSEYIPAYTHNNIFYTRTANLFFISDEEASERFFLNNYFETITPDFIEQKQRSLFGVRYVDAYGHTKQGNKLRKLLGFKLIEEESLPKTAITRALETVSQIQSKPFSEQLKKYRVDYLIWPQDRILPEQLKYLTFKKVFETEHYAIYKY